MELHFLTLISEELIIVHVRKNADEESRLLNMIENLELEEEEKQFLTAEQDEVQEVPVSKKKAQEEENSATNNVILLKKKNKFTI